jgi:DNA-directed RNA polymerase subunit K/omega
MSLIDDTKLEMEEKELSDNEIDDSDTDKNEEDDEVEEEDDEQDQEEDDDDDEEEDDMGKIMEESSIIDQEEVIDENVEEDLEVSDDEEDYQKFENYSLIENLENEHPEIRSINFEEVIALTRVQRDSYGNIIDPLHTSMPFLTKYEKARIIGSRAEQLDRGAIPFVRIDENIINGRTIAMMEFEQKKIPFIIARPMPNKGVEYWKMQDLEVL